MVNPGVWNRFSVLLSWRRWRGTASFLAGLLVAPVGLDGGFEPVEAGRDLLVLVGGDPGTQQVGERSRELLRQL
jgi:hypothetical protein